MQRFYDSLRDGLSTFFGWVPNLIGAIIILVIAYFVGKLIAVVVEKVLRKAGANKLLHRGKAAEVKGRIWPGLEVSHLLARVVFWFIFLIGLLLALSTLQLRALTEMIQDIVHYIPNVIVALLIIFVAAFIAASIRGFLARVMQNNIFGRAVSLIAPAIVIAIGGFMALAELQIALQIVVGTYLIVLSAIGLGFAIAFGLGGRGVAGQMLDKSYEEAQKQAPESKAQVEAMTAPAATASHTQEQAETDTPEGLQYRDVMESRPDDPAKPGPGETV